ncbi:MAG TPA: pyridoxal-phosphate dependent enzyme [Rhodanobacteraceae bacterium]|jgi:threonine dehydratase|nr:pyridoxal-phosphate dependent enzyme [Rhodanobacteraceae bacterium]
MNPTPPTSIADIRVAAARIAGHAVVTPVMRSGALDDLAGAKLHFKCEHLQVGGAFKFRGACNAVWALSDEEAGRGVVTHSSGNHGAALALAARTRGIPAHVVVPEGAVRAKLENIEAAGATLHHCAPTLAAREETCARIQRETGATLVHPYADRNVIAGQGTAALELLQQVPELDVLVAPLGGGGLTSGTAVVVRALSPGTQLIAAEPAGADDGYRSLQRGERVTDVKPDTICDGLRATIGEINFEMLRDNRVEIITISDEQVLAAMRLLWTHLKQTIEPSSSTVLAALLAQRGRFAGKRVGLILSGGNVDLDRIAFAR